MVEISADVGGVVKDLKRIDPHLGVRFAESAPKPFWAVFWQSSDERTTYLVTTVQAHQNSLGVWEGLDQRVVRRIERINPENGYDYATELQKENERVERERKQRFRERVGGTAEEAAFAVRKDTGARYRGRTFVPRDIPA